MLFRDAIYLPVCKKNIIFHCGFHLLKRRYDE